MSSLDPRDFDAQEIEDAILAVVEQAPTIPRMYGRDGETEEWPDNYHLVFKVARSVSPEHTGNWPGDGFAGKVKRIAAVLADEGRLVKRPGLNRGGQPGYATPEFAVTYDARIAAVKADLTTQDERFKALVRRAAPYGLEAGGDRGGVVLSLDEFERLLDRLGEPW